MKNSKYPTYLMNITLFSASRVPAIIISPLLIVAEVIIKGQLISKANFEVFI